METLETQQTQRLGVERLASQLLARKIIVPRFKFPLTENQAFELLLAAYKAEVAYRRRTFIQTDGTTEAIGKLARLLTAATSKFGVMFCGTPGNGKTTLLHALRSAINYLYDRGAFPPDAVAKGMVLVAAKDLPEYAKEYRAFHDLMRKPMLAVDDVGREPSEVLNYGNALTPVTDLIEYRYNAQLFTLLTTNLKASEISERYGRRIADRFNEMLEVIIFRDETFRR